MDRITHFYYTYKNIIDFLELNGALLPRVQPKYLLKYDYYVIYETKIHTHDSKELVTILDQQAFIHRSKECWLDLILQIFKVLVLPRVNWKFKGNSIAKPRNSFLMYELNDKTLDPEKKILTWACIHYNTNLENLGKLDSEPYKGLETKKVMNLTQDFCDGLVIIALILAYMPYMKQSLKYIYVHADTAEKSFHNACKITDVLKMVNCSFHLRPSDIVSPFPAQMLMFLAYIYEIFPYFQPMGSIKFQVTLSQIKTEDITLKNPNTHKLYYKLIFIDNDSGNFSVDRNQVEIPPENSVTIKVQYLAKIMMPTTTTLIICGETIGGHFARSLVYTLEGIPICGSEHTVLEYKIPLYSSEVKNLHVKSPYANACTYKVVTSWEKPTSYKHIQSFRKQNSGISKINIVVIKTDTLECNANGEGDLVLTVFCLCPEKQESYIIFLNETHGDFLMKVNVIANSITEMDKERIRVRFPIEKLNSECSCGSTRITFINDCPKVFAIPIPRRNNKLWSLINQMFMEGIEENEIGPWKNVLGMYIHI